MLSSKEALRIISIKRKKYRLITEKVDNSLYLMLRLPCYCRCNTTQLEEALNVMLKLIVIMIEVSSGSYLLRLVCLAKWSRRPIQESLEKQEGFCWKC